MQADKLPRQNHIILQVQDITITAVLFQIDCRCTTLKTD